ncbi:cyclic peptide export ABC transporter [Polyangium jinanense]|uniref:Cyclic peptide export ABC transporter n=1 Tax=Polyangium jinanense TaxID=2829994 RepID=A0A9X4AYM9_9BACT|nr:cyclic peptide export ABC transporter [Polyangium jinanense]MDC3961005.1 cyclic peptide export ABC transporter [Polyangium jinanense]MDC3987425.1 cyclic peptide export ABC transporter [Polyangium jinanense]
MYVIDLLLEEAKGQRASIFAVATMGGIANALLLVGANVLAGSPEQADLRALFLFGLTMALYVLGARATYHRTTSLVEAVLHRVRTRIVEKIERTELEGLERVGTAEIFDRVTENMSVVSEQGWVLGSFLQALFVLVFGLVYIAWISLPAFALIALMLVFGFFIVQYRFEEVVDVLRQMGQLRLELFDMVMDLLKGFKEAKFSRRRGREIHDDIVGMAESLRIGAVRTAEGLSGVLVMPNCVLYILLGAVIFTMPRYVDVDAETMASLVTCTAFVWGPFTSVAGGLNAVFRSSVAFEQIRTLEGKLDEAVERAAVQKTEDPWNGRIGTLSTRDIVYEYPTGNGDRSFRVGPLSLDIEPGEVVFLVGGNGSGKSTLLKVLTGLYPRSGGELRVGGVLVQPENVAAYREMISAIYSDFHLFSKLYGMLDAEPEAVRALLAQMGLEGKTSFEAQQFTRRTLSTGQRRRLYTIMTLLEDRPVYVFDEWAADQDPGFRRYFYEELVPALKGRGKTVIAVTHDDRYFHCADRVIKLSYGKVQATPRMDAP